MPAHLRQSGHPQGASAEFTYSRTILFLIVILSAAVPQSLAQSTITTVAGTEWVFNSDGKPALAAPLGDVAAQTFDSSGNLVFADPGNNMVIRLNPSGTITVLAGNGLAGYSGDGGLATNASLNYPLGIGFDSKGNLYIADTGNDVIRKVTSNGVISTFAGTRNNVGFSGDNGPAINASLFSPFALAIDSSDTVYFSQFSNINDPGPNRIRKITTDGTITLVAGSGNGFAGEGVPAAQAVFNQIEDLAFDAKGNLYLADTGNNRIRRIDPKGIITTVAGNGTPGYSGDGGPATQASLQTPFAIAVDAASNLYVADQNNFVVRKVDPSGKISTFAGNGRQAYAGDGKPASAASFVILESLAADAAGNLFIGDNDRLRKVNAGAIISTVGGNGQFRIFPDGTPASNVFLDDPWGIVYDSAGDLYVADYLANRIRVVAKNGATSTIAGNGLPEFAGDNGPAIQAGLAGPTSVALDKLGNIYICDSDNGLIRKITPDGTIRTVVQGLNSPQQILVDGSNNLYISDTLDNLVARLGTDGTVTIIGSGNLNLPQGMAFDSAGNLYVADFNNKRIVRFSANGVLTPIAGGGSRPVNPGDSFPAMLAQLGRTLGVTLDANGNLYFTDGTYRVYEVTTAGNISVVAGNGKTGFSGDGGPSAQASFNFPHGLAIDPSGTLMIADSVNNRIRAVLAAPPTLQSSPASLTFESAGQLPAAQNIAIASSLPGMQYTLAATTTTGGTWLQANYTNGTIPATVQVLADPTGLAPGTYQGTVAIAAPGTTPPSTAVKVTFKVDPPPAPVLALGADACLAGACTLSFSLVQGAAPASSNLTVLNQGGGSLPFTATAATDIPGTWLSASPSSGTATPTAPASVVVQADPTGLLPGTYTGAVTIASAAAGTVRVAVVLTVSAATQTILVSQAGLTFTAVSGGGTPLDQNFAVLNAGQGTLSWTVQSSTLGGGNWLIVTPSSGSSAAGASNVPLVDVAIDPANLLPPGQYYGSIQVFSPAAANSPQTVTVVLQVLPPGTDPGPDVRPSGLVFTGAAGSAPGSQNVFVSNLTASGIGYSSSRSTHDGAAWFVGAPTNATVLPNQPQRVVVQPDFSALAPGTYNGTLQLAFGAGVTRSVNILAFVGGSAGATSAPSAFTPQAVTAASCTDHLVVNLLTPTANFTATATNAITLQASVFDNCQHAVTNAGVNATFQVGSTKSSATLNLVNGTYIGTWTPTTATPPQVSVQVFAVALLNSVIIGGYTPPITGTLTAGTTPILNPAVVNGASFIAEALVAPGGLITVFGQQVTDPAAPDACTPTSGPPYATQMGGAQVFLDGQALALLYACDQMQSDGSTLGQINAQVPYNISINSGHQLLMQRTTAASAAQSVPVNLSVAATQPGIFTVSQNGLGQGEIFVVQTDGSLSPTPADLNTPAHPGDTVAILCSGLGLVAPPVPLGSPAPPAPPSSTTNTVTVNIGGQSANVISAGLIPGQSVEYEVQVVVPQGLTSGNQVVTISSGGQTSPPVTMGVQAQ